MVDPPACDVGLGTAYERWAIHRKVREWCDASAPATALEGPVDGMAGMPGLHLLPLARTGTRVTVVLPQPEAVERVREVYDRAGLEDRLETSVGDELPVRRSFDVVLSFNALPLVADWRRYLRRLISLTVHRLLLFVTNPYSYGAWMCRAFRAAGMNPGRGGGALFDHESTRPRVLAAALAEHACIRETAWVDCPWWPDWFVSAGQTLWGALLRRGTGGDPDAERTRPFVYGPAGWPFAQDRCPPPLARALRRHPVFETRGHLSRLVFGHHRALLVAPRRGSSAPNAT